MSDTVAVTVLAMKPTFSIPTAAERRAGRGQRLPAAVFLWLVFTPGAAVAVCDTLPQPDGPVLALTTDSAGQVLYVAGDFTQLGAHARNHLAAVDLESCEVSGWNPNPNGPVRAFWLSEDGSTLYVGGDFTSIGGQFRGRLAGIESATGLPIQWTPSANDSVHALIPSRFNSSFYVGGAFTIVNGVAARHGFVELTRLNGFITSPRFDFGVGKSVRVLARGRDRLYLAGDFASVTVFPPDSGVAESKDRQRIAALEIEDHVLSDWNPQPDGSVLRALRIAADDRVLYAGGDFSAVGDAARTGIVALDPVSGETLVWDPQLNGEARAILPSFDRSMLYLGGDFTTVGAINRDYLSLVRAADASVVDLDFGAIGGTVCALHRSEDTAGGVFRVYAGGGHCDEADTGPAGWLASFAAIPPEQQAPLTTAVPPGGLFNSTTIGPIALACDDFGGSGCAITYYTTNGDEPDEESQVYSSLINLTSSLVLKFFSIDQVGNVEPVRTEVYEVETTPPATIATPGSRVFEERQLAVTLSCTDSESGCDATYYTIDGTQPTIASNLYTGPVVLTGTTVLQFFSADVAGNREGIQRQEYVRNHGEAGSLSLIEAALALAGLGWWRRRGKA